MPVEPKPYTAEELDRLLTNYTDSRGITRWPMSSTVDGLAEYVARLAATIRELQRRVVEE